MNCANGPHNDATNFGFFGFLTSKSARSIVQI